MKIVHPDLKHQIELQENKVNLIVVENQMFFYDLILDLVRQCREGAEGRLVLSKEDEILSFEKKAVVLTDPFDMDINNRKLLSKLSAVLKEQVYTDNLYLSTNKMLGELEVYLDQLTENVEFAIDYDTNVDITGVFKLVGLKLRKEYSNKLEQLLDYLEILQQLTDISIVALVNFKSFLSKEECEQLYDFAIYKKIQLVLLEGHMSDEHIEGECTYIIDKDGCEIY